MGNSERSDGQAAGARSVLVSVAIESVKGGWFAEGDLAADQPGKSLIPDLARAPFIVRALRN